MKKEILEEIIRVANSLDSSGFIKEANVLDKVAKRIKVSASFGTGGLFGGSSAFKLRDFIFSQFGGSSDDIYLWSQGKSEVENPPKEIRNIIMGMNPKIYGDKILFDNVNARNYFKTWIKFRTLGDEPFSYILDHNEEYLKLYRDFGRPTQKQNVHMIRKFDTDILDEGGFDFLEETEDKFGIERLDSEIRKDKNKLPKNTGGNSFGKSKGGFFGGKGGKRR